MSMINAVAPTGAFIIQSSLIELTGVVTSALSTGDLISNGKISISGISFEKGGIVELKNMRLYQNTTGTLQNIAMDLYVFTNNDTSSQASGDAFALDSSNTIYDLIRIEIQSTDWHSADSSNSYVDLDLNKYLKIEDTESQSLAFMLVARGTATFDAHTLKTRFVFKQHTKD